MLAVVLYLAVLGYALDPYAVLVPFLLEGVGGRIDLNQADRIHPTEKGHVIIADNVWKVLRPLL